MKVIHTANAGIILQSEEGTIAFDPFHTQETPPFSSVPEDTIINLSKSCKIDVLVYTHIHPDHFSESWTRYYLHHHEAEVIMPPHEIATMPISDNFGELDAGFTKLQYGRLIHNDKKYADVLNYGFYFTLEGKKIMILGDSELDAPELPSFCEGKSPDILFVNFPFVALSKGKDALNNIIKPKKVVVYHLPFRKNDRFNFYEAVKKRAAMPGMPEVAAILTECMQTIEI